MTHDSDCVTQLCERIAAGDQTAKDQLMDCVYHELRRMAKRQIRRERRGHTLGPTGLVHECFLRLKGPALEKDRAYFFAAAAEAMCRILVEYARKRRPNCVPIDRVLSELEATHRVSLTDLHNSLEKLRQFGGRGERQYQVVVRRFFLGMTWKEIASSLEIAVRTAEQDWQLARAWLYTQLNKGDEI